MVGIMIFCMDYSLISVLEIIDLGSFIGYFDGNVNNMGGTSVFILVGGIMNDSDIGAMKR